MYAAGFYNGAYAAARDNAATGRRRFQQDFCSAMTGDNSMGNSRARQRNLTHITLRLLRAFADAIRHAAGFTDANTDATFVIPNDNHCAECKAATTLNDFGDTLNVYDALVEFLAVFVAPITLSSISCHRFPSILEF
jgi:hypothetical protein